MTSKPLHLALWQLRIPSAAKNLAARIEAYQAMREGWCFASNETLAKEIGVTVESVRRALRVLRSLRVLVEEPTPRTTKRRLVQMSDPDPHGSPSPETPIRPARDPDPSCTSPRSVPIPKEREREMKRESVNAIDRDAAGRIKQRVREAGKT